LAATGHDYSINEILRERSTELEDTKDIPRFP